MPKLTGKTTWTGRTEDYPLENYPDYVPGKTPRLDAVHKVSYLDELEAIWGKRWGGSQGIGKLREVAICKATEWESSALWERDPTFFLPSRRLPDWRRIAEDQERLAEVFEENGVKVYWMEYEDKIGAYGPMSGLYYMGGAKMFRGGAIVARPGSASRRRGKEREWTKYLVKIGCPILLTISGNGISEVVFLPIAEDVLVTQISSACNQDGIDQCLPVLEQAGVKEIHIAYGTTILDSWEAGGEFHIDMVLGTVNHRLAVVYPAQLDYGTYAFLKSKGFTLIEIPPDEQRQYLPANLVLLEPGRVIMPKGAQQTIAAVRSHGVEVIEFDNSGLLQGGGGIHCVVMDLVRDPGPSLDE